jgi:hypothetical protein
MTINEQDRRYAEDHEAFITYLEKASTTVESWPEWKRTILGGTVRPNCRSTACSIRNVAADTVPPKPQE